MVVAFGSAFLRAFTGKDRAVEIQREAFGGLLELSEQPAEKGTKERLDIALGEACKEAQDRIIAREAFEAQQGV